MTVQEKIIELSDIWYTIVGMDHHKDRDCHWELNSVFSYGKMPVYKIIHYGYIYEYVEEEYDRYELAEAALCHHLHQAFQKEVHWANKVLTSDGWDASQIHQAKTIKEFEPKVQDIIKA